MRKKFEIIAHFKNRRKLRLHWKGKIVILFVLLLIMGIFDLVLRPLERPELSANTESHLDHHNSWSCVVSFAAFAVIVGLGVVHGTTFCEAKLLEGR